METVEVIIAPSSETSHRACDCFFEGQRISKGQESPMESALRYLAERLQRGDRVNFRWHDAERPFTYRFIGVTP
jgi:hypothetical protein